MAERTRARGELEAAIMESLWAETEPMTARDIQDRIDGRVPALTTLLTALDRLRKKGRVVRTDGDRGVRFQAACTQAEHASQAMLEALGDTHDRGATLLRFAGELAGEDVALLQQAIAQRDASAAKKRNR